MFITLISIQMSLCYCDLKENLRYAHPFAATRLLRVLTHIRQPTTIFTATYTTNTTTNSSTHPDQEHADQQHADQEQEGLETEPSTVDSFIATTVRDN